jgi:lysophospholipase L1-like esterase
MLPRIRGGARIRLIYGPMGRLFALGLLAGVTALAAAAPAVPGRSTVPLRYIALGDSFSSGEGVPPFRPGTDQLLPVHDTCDRSFRAYPALIAGRRSSPGTWGFWACSGAIVADMTHTNHENPGEIAQLDRIAAPGRTDPRVQLVTVTIGGNDAQFASTTTACVLARIVPGLAPCQGDWRARDQDAIARLRTTLPTLYRAIHSRAPNARILVLGYPDPFPAVAQQFSKCRLWFLPEDLRFLHDEDGRLNATIRAATLSAANTKVTYVAPTGFAGHDACSPSPWFNGLNVIPTQVGFSFHPNVLGQRRLAKIVLATI